MKIEENISLKPFNSFGVDVNSRYFFELTNVEQVVDISQLPEPRLFLGGGSNILFTQNFPGTVILNALKGIEVLDENRLDATVRVMGGEVWHDFVLMMNERGFHGLEYLALIPGTVGASPVQNIGAYGFEVKDYIQSVEVYDVKDQSFKTFSNEACEFTYRDSLFKQSKGRYFIIAVTFILSKVIKAQITYRALLDYFEQVGLSLDNLTMRDVLDGVVAIRSSKLPDPKEIGNGGSFFKNPIVPLSKALALKAKYPQLVTYPQDGGLVKLAAGQLIELAGFKGQYQGDVGMYEKQALVLVNLGGATGEMLVTHALKVQAGVASLFEVELEPEPLIF